MHLLILGLSHKTAPVEIREGLAFPENQLKEYLQLLIQEPHLAEVVIISTCNRTEICVVSSDIEEGKKELIKFLTRSRGIPKEKFLDYLYFYTERAAIQHLFRVASSLDSMMVGEPQILGQVKEAYNHAYQAGVTSLVLNRLFRYAFEVGKKVRTETEIGESAVSISYAAVQLAKTVFEDLSDRVVMVIGAGEMSELTVRHLVSNGVKSIFVTNRTYQRAVELAEKFNGQAVKFEERVNNLVNADIIISSTGAPFPIIKKEDVIKVMKMRKNKPLFFIDIAVPRDIEPEVGKLYNVFLYDIDDLESVVKANIDERSREAEKAEKIVENKVEDFATWLTTLEVVPTIKELIEKAEEIKATQLEKYLKKLGNIGEKEKNLINALASGIVNKFLHEPIIKLKEVACQKDGYLYVESLRHLFDLKHKELKEGKKG